MNSCKLHVDRKKAPGVNHRLSTALAMITSIAIPLLFGCGDNTEVKVVDFSPTVSVEQPGRQASNADSFRVAVGAMISPRETVHLYHDLLDYIAEKLGREIEFVQRKTYGQINELFTTEQIDLAFICSGPYATGKDRCGFHALAVPQINGKHLYHSYLIVNKESPYKEFSDLKGKIFAFTDPDSNTGRLVPAYWLSLQGETPENYFGKTIYTYSHDNSIMAVAKDLVDGAAVHGQIWEYYNARNPVYTSKTRIIKKSIGFGNPLLVAARQLPNRTKKDISDLLFVMHQDRKGKKILDELMIDRFIAPDDQWYKPILAMKQKCDQIQ
jgi:phosphonate transport system substrate-binding protein